MSRAIRKPAAERRADITAAAIDLALEEGLAGITMRAVATRIGVAPALVAHYEPNMDELVTSTFRAIVGGELDELEVQLAPVSSASKKLDLLVGTLLDGSRDAVTHVWVDGWSLGRRNEILAEGVRAEMDRWHAAITRILVDGSATGEFRVREADAVAWQILGMIDGLNAHALVRWGRDADRADLLRSVLDAILRTETAQTPTETTSLKRDF
ncbi:TetR/AcrR family transcriptional regulator [Pseudoclavibacter sp. VKM Ac-2888]|uniref:TetR/AcrR family transcriptional regulator n=1 Tax=Pseudoclavibacter sp. VKM Ac-2888 TaxID=2783830 RepID=UPI00188B664D|nr:TetR family transcriptional regulator C-terminal domain-containing protein [Pseudoclavibacter sp. VKM Ac-2888]MBF4550252.1 TetR family transcriptional regulator C-terminal domain-containing protein [Pseudoclavibacter sp. VKM Ac-2888]